MAKDPELLAHQQWLGYLQPVGLVVSPPALLQAQAVVSVNVAAEHQRFLDHVGERVFVGRTEPLTTIKDLRGLLLDVFGWQAGDFIEAGDPRAAALEVVLTEYHETLRPTYAVPEDARAEPLRWLLLVQELPPGTPLDEVGSAEDHRWQATPHARFERLLRETQVPIGLLSNGTHLRLVYAPRGETAGHLTFPVQFMTEVAGRPIFAALLMLLSADRLFSLPDRQRLPAILAESRKYQNTVSTELARQVLAALYELLRGFQAADDLRKGEMLRDVLARDPDSVYAGLLTVLLRLVFLLYAEDRGLMSDDEVYVQHYSVTGLFERLRIDEGRYPDTMDQRYGAWAQLLTLFRLVYDGGGHGKFRLPARHGYLFNPDRYPFLEGRPYQSLRQPGERLAAPLVADGVIFRVLRNLLILDGERISYRSLDVEQIGSVYETIMGFRLEIARGRSIAVKPVKAHGASVTINLEELLQVPGKDRGKWLKEKTDQGLTGAALNALKAADTPEAVVAALDRKVARDLTPDLVAKGVMVLQPSDERRRSGSHYTPRSLTGPIVRKALEPVLKQLGEQPTPAQILALKVCDPAMGSGAFLVETCRQLGDVLLKAWGVHGGMPKVPDDETPELFAQRTIAQRCLYGVDKNPLAVDLAKLSLWLATLAKDHAFTFLDHALRCGDSLVGLTRQQIADFHWKKVSQRVFAQDKIEVRIDAATRARQEILEGGDFMSPLLKAQKLAVADESLGLVSFTGNVAVSAFFAADNDRRRQERRDDLLGAMTTYLKGDLSAQPTAAERELRTGEKGITPCHWEIEFPEVFGRENGGFDCIVGNPPFAGKNTIIEGHADGYVEWLKAIHDESHGNADVVAHFYRRAFHILRSGGTLGLIATNTIAQGDTRVTGLRWICTHGGTIYAARRRVKWPGLAAVTVSIIHVCKGDIGDRRTLDGREVPVITAFLFHMGANEDPSPLQSNEGFCFPGCKVAGQGFVFDDDDPRANPISDMRALLEQEPTAREIIRPYYGGDEILNCSTVDPLKYVIAFGTMKLEQAKQYPTVLRFVEQRVKPERETSRLARHPWWQFERPRPELARALSRMKWCIVKSSISEHFLFARVPATAIYSHNTTVFVSDSFALLACLQSRVHEIFGLFFSSGLEDRGGYRPSDAFLPFPLPVNWNGDDCLTHCGTVYDTHRNILMATYNVGLTATYNRFHDPNEASADIARLRELHAAMDRAVLDAYGWTDLKPTCAFLLDYEEDEDEEEVGGRQRKKPWRYRWPDDFRDEVLARLLDLNKRRAEEESLAGATEKPKKVGRKTGKKQPPDTPGLF